MKKQTIVTKRLFLAGAIVVLILLAGNPSLQSQAVNSNDLSKLANVSTFVVRGSVISIDSYWFDSTIYTDIRIAVLQDFLGNFSSPDGCLTLTEPGGTIGDQSVVVNPGHSFRVGEEVLIFVETTPDGRFIVSKNEVGKITLSTNDCRPSLSRTGPSVVSYPTANEPLTITRNGYELLEQLTQLMLDMGFSPRKPSVDAQASTPAFEEKSLRVDGGPGMLPEHCYSCGTYDYGTYTPTTSWQTHSSSVGGGGSSVACRWYRFYVTSGRVYTFSTCQGGGSYSGDPKMWLYNSSCGYLTSRDDNCSRGPEFVWTATYTGYLYLKMASYDSNSAGWTLAYRYTVPTPAISSVSPGHAPAGVGSAGPAGSLVTITGSNFGVKASADHVYFWKMGSTYVADDSLVVAWSNTQIKCYVPKGASSKDCAVLKNGLWSNFVAFSVDWSYGGRKWPSFPVTYYINQNGTPDCTGEFTAVRASLQTWEDVPYCNADYTYGGTTSRTVSGDGYNVATWIESNWPYGSGAIAVTTTYYSGSTIVEADIAFNGQDYLWSDSGQSGRMDVQNICTHEAGHGFVGLSDLYGSPDSEKTMYGYASTGETKKRSLDTLDVAGAQWIY